MLQQPAVVPLATGAVPFAAELERHGDALAVVTDAGTLTYAELAERVRALTGRLGTVRRLVAVAARNDLGSLVAYLAALRGGHAVLVLPADRGAAADPVLRVYDPDVVLTAAGSEVLVDERRPGTCHDLHPELALLLSTSGSTGSPKLVRLSRDNVRSNAEAIAQSLGIRPDDRAATTLPMTYCYGLSVINSHLSAGAALVLTGLSVVDPCFWRLARSAGVTTFAAVPYTVELLDRVGFPEMDLPDLRYVTQAGGRLDPDVVRRYAHLGRARGWGFVVMYGQTEATARMTVLPADLAAEHPQSIGRPVPGGAFRIDPVPGLADGELVYQGPNVMLGYAEGPQDLALGRTVVELRTGDLGRRRPDGLYEVVGRRSRFVKVVGLRVDLGQVEQVLAGTGVVAAATGTDELLVVAVEGDHDEGLLGAVLAERLGLPRAAVAVHAVEHLPRVASGKPDHPAVVALHRSRVAALPSDSEPPADGPAGVRRIFREELGRQDVEDDSTFVGLGGDSLSYVATSVRLEASLGDVPADWHVLPVAELEARARRRRPARRLLAPLETSIVLRAVAIVLIVGTHAKLFAWPGTAHVLLAVAGYNFARFQIVGERAERLRRQARSLARVVVPSVAFIGAAALLTDRYGPANVLLLNSVVGSPTWTPQWHFWFVEVLVYLLLGAAVLLALPWGDRAERRFPLGLPVALTLVGLLTRFEVVDLWLPHTAPVLWLFALGWALARAQGVTARLALSLLAAVSVPGFFGDPRREAVVLAGLLLLAWVPALPVPARLHRVVGVLASASLYAYLTHWLVYPMLVPVDRVLAVVASLLVGVAYWALATRAPAVVARWWRSAHGSAVAAADRRPVRPVRSRDARCESAAVSPDRIRTKGATRA